MTIGKGSGTCLGYNLAPAVTHCIPHVTLGEEPLYLNIDSVLSFL